MTWGWMTRHEYECIEELRGSLCGQQCSCFKPRHGYPRWCPVRYGAPNLSHWISGKIRWVRWRGWGVRGSESSDYSILWNITHIGLGLPAFLFFLMTYCVLLSSWYFLTYAIASCKVSKVPHCTRSSMFKCLPCGRGCLHFAAIYL